MKNKKTIIIVLVILEIVSVSLMWKSFSNKETILDNVKLKEKLTNNESFAIMIEQDDGTYIQSSTSSFPSNMAYNSELSGCIDNNGNKLNDVLSYDETQKLANVTTQTTTYCYLYFDNYKKVSEVCNSSDSLSSCITSSATKINNLWNSTLEDDGYRFVGTNPSNYICFGTNDKNECTTDTDKYMYRIIGIFEDEQGNNHLKLIKKEALNTAYAWNSNYTDDVEWNESDLYKGLNGSYFLTNTSYPYMQNETWTNKISAWNYTMTNTLTYSSSYGPNYYHTPTQAIYLHELNGSERTSQTCYYDTSIYSSSYCSNGTWINLGTKISLMYASDYQLSLGSAALSYTGYLNHSTLKTGWMHISNNDTGNPGSSYEWTMSRCGAFSDGYYYAWRVHSNGGVHGPDLTDTNAVRPVFYLEPNVEYGSGTGTIEDPIILKDDVAPAVNTTINDNNTATPTLTITSDESGTYCVNTNATASDMSNCVFEGKITANISITSKAFTYDGTYYVHVKDNSGNVGISSTVNITIKTTVTLAEQIKSTTPTGYNTTMEGGLNRFQGTIANNYVCFGTSDKSTCTGNTDAYMYRIIGIDSSNRIKLIKKEALNSTYQWYSNYTTNITWPNSLIYSNINGSAFLSNTTYMPNTTWTNKIETMPWKYGDNTTYNTTAANLYSIENNWTSTVSAKIGLWYMHDYYYGMSGGNNCSGSGAYTTCKTSWMFITNSDSGTPSQYEWTMSRYGAYSNGIYSAWSVYSDGYVNDYTLTISIAVRPVFYLTSTVEYSSGSGTLSDPYMILS